MKIKNGNDLVKRLNADDLFGLDVQEMISDYQKLQTQQEFSIQINYAFETTFEKVFNALILKPNGRFVEFTLGYTQLPQHIFDLFTSVRWAFLQTIKIVQSPIGDKGLLTLSKCSLPQIKSITLDMCGIKDEGAFYISEAKWPSLQKLAIWRNQISLKGFEILIKGIWPKLETLDFGNIEGITQEKQEEFDYYLQQKFDFPLLKSLRIGNCDGLGKICGINEQNMEHLENLNILSSPVCPLAIFDNNKEGNWDSLKQLTIGSQRLQSSQIENVLQTICTFHFPNLKVANIIYPYLTKKTVRQFVKTQWPLLQSLKLGTFNQQFDCGVEMMRIVRKCKWKELAYLETQVKNINTVGLLREADWPNLKQIYVVNAEQTKLNSFVAFYLPKQRLFFKQRQTFYNPQVIQNGFVVSWTDQLPFNPFDL